MRVNLPDVIKDNPKAFSFRAEEPKWFKISTIGMFFFLIASLFIGLLHWYDITVLITSGEVRPILGLCILGFFLSTLGVTGLQQVKLNTLRNVEEGFTVWLAEHHGLVSERSFWKMFKGRTNVYEEEFTDMNGKKVNRKFTFEDDWGIDGDSTKFHRVQYGKISILDD